MTEKKITLAHTVAQSLIKLIKQGVAPWQRPWDPAAAAHLLPFNPTTGNRYRGINVLILGSIGYEDPRWMTYKQAQAQGWQVKRGARSTTIQYWKLSDDRASASEDGNSGLAKKTGQQKKTSTALAQPRLFLAHVFNAEQVEGIPSLEVRASTWEDHDRVEALIASSRAKIVHAPGNQAFYRPGTDSIHMPEKGQFPKAQDYYATLLHELGHWSGHNSRLNRDLSHPMGSSVYAKEELRAEICSWMLGMEYQLPNDPQRHAAYVGHWVEILSKDPLEIFRAAADAEKMLSYLVGLDQTRVQSSQPNVSLPDVVLQEAAGKAPVTQVLSADVVKPRLLTVPFEEKEAVKKLGARWSAQFKSWFVPEGLDATLFAAWMSPAGGANKSSERVYLDVPYEKRAEIRALGGVWDTTAKSWFVLKDSQQLEAVSQWLIKPLASREAGALDPREEFARVLINGGAMLDAGQPWMDGKTHRINVSGDRSGEKSGFYVGYLDGHPAGYFKNNRTGEEVRWKSKGYVLPSGVMQTIRQKSVEVAKQRKEDRDREYKKTAAFLQARLEGLPAANNQHPYLLNKQVGTSLGIKVDPETQTLHIPLYDAEGALCTVQTIDALGNKRFAKGGKKEGAFFVVGGFRALPVSAVIVLAEGYATAATVFECCRIPVVACFDAGNLKAVAIALKDRFPDKSFVILGDDDKHVVSKLGKNPGRLAANAAAKAVSGRAVFPMLSSNFLLNPEDKLTDFNDMANKTRLGREGVTTQLSFSIRVSALKLDRSVGSDIKAAEEKFRASLKATRRRRPSR